MLSDKIGTGITIGAKTTINTPDGSRVVSVGVKLVTEGIALGMQIEKDGKQTDYAATFDTQSLAQFVFAIGYYARKAIDRKGGSPAPNSAQGAEGVPGEEKGYTP